MKVLTLLIATAMSLNGASLSNKHYINSRKLKISQNNDSLFIYKKVDPQNAGDVDAEGDICLFDLKRHKSFTIAQHEVLAKTEAWITQSGNIVVFRSSGIDILKKDNKKIEGFNFDANQRVLGANYNLTMNSIFFLLMDENTNQVDLCRFNLKGLELKRIKRDLKISLDDGEAPFKKLFFDLRNNLLIENDCNSMLSVELYGNYNLHVLQFNKEDCNGYAVNVNNRGIIYLKYKNKNHDFYDIKQYSLNNSEVVTLFTGKNTNRESVEVYLYTNKDLSPFVIGIDNKYYIYNYSSFKKLKIEGDSDIAYISSDFIYYLSHDGKLNEISY